MTYNVRQYWSANIFYTKQFGYKSKHSSDHAILCTVDRIQKAIIDNCTFSCDIFLDFSTAFDTVNHEILINKLKYFGYWGLFKQWLISYLGEFYSMFCRCLIISFFFLMVICLLSYCFSHSKALASEGRIQHSYTYSTCSSPFFWLPCILW